LSRTPETDAANHETIARQELHEYASVAPEKVLDAGHQISEHDLHATTEMVSTAKHQVDEMLGVIQEKGIKNALSVLEKLGDAHVTDEVHRRLIEDIRGGVTPSGLKEGIPPWQVLHMSLFSVALPEQKEDGAIMELTALMNAMEQFFAGMQSIGNKAKPLHYSIEIAVAEGSDEIVFYVAVPSEFVNLFEKQILSLFPHAIVTHEQHDYNIFSEHSSAQVSVANLQRHPIYPLRTHDSFEVDPLNVLLNAFSKIEREGGGAAIQLVVQAGGKSYQGVYNRIVKRVRDGEKPDVAIRKSTFTGEMFEAVKDMASTAISEAGGSDKDDKQHLSEREHHALEEFQKKVERPIAAANLRIAVSAETGARATQIMREIEASFHQFENTKGNKITFEHLSGGAQKRALKAFSFREFNGAKALPFSFTELASLIHFPSEGVESSPQFKQSRAKGAAAPLE
ncbi:MAG: hypothetical protein AAFO91_10620, partial [Bacteroidota bacterium]